MYASHASYSACGLGSDGTDHLVALVREAGPRLGLYGAKITGGGSGGTVAVLGERGAQRTVSQIADLYGRESGHGSSVYVGFVRWVEGIRRTHVDVLRSRIEQRRVFVMRTRELLERQLRSSRSSASVPGAARSRRARRTPPSPRCVTSTVCEGVTPGPPPPPGATKGPCDIYAEDGGPCVAAHSTVRALYGGYSGPLYQVKKSDGTTKDIGVLEAGGLANGAEQDAFCGIEACTISKIYDQSGWGNHLTRAPPSMIRPTETNESNAKALPVMFGSNKAYGVRIVPGGGYRNNGACGTATCDNPETEYMVVGGEFFNGGCCFDYGNMERNSRNNHEGTMEAVYFGTCIDLGQGGRRRSVGHGRPRRRSLGRSTSPYEPNKPVTHKYVVGMVKGRRGRREPMGDQERQCAGRAP